MGKADLHIHTTYSDGMGTVSAVLEAASRTDLDAIAITDHNTVRGALEACELAGRYGVQVIPGIEISTAEGHLLALFVEEPVPAGQPLIDTVLRVAALGGLCIAPHPMALGIPGLSAASIWRALSRPEVGQTLVGLEVHNGSLPYLRSNRRAQDLGNQTTLAQVASSDSHLLWTIGLCATIFPGKSVPEVRQALEHRLVQPWVQPRPARFYLSFAGGHLLRRLGLAWWAPEPGQGIVLRRLAGSGAGAGPV